MVTITTIQITKETWLRLSQRKAYPSQTFDTIITNLLDYEKAQLITNINKGGNENDSNTKHAIQDKDMVQKPNNYPGFNRD